MKKFLITITLIISTVYIMSSCTTTNVATKAKRYRDSHIAASEAVEANWYVSYSVHKFNGDEYAAFTSQNNLVKFNKWIPDNPKDPRTTYHIDPYWGNEEFKAVLSGIRQYKIKWPSGPGIRVIIITVFKDGTLDEIEKYYQGICHVS